MRSVDHAEHALDVKPHVTPPHVRWHSQQKRYDPQSNADDNAVAFGQPNLRFLVVADLQVSAETKTKMLILRNVHT